MDALREAVNNAVCHRDYGHPGGSVTIEMYDDRLDITNIGRLPEGWTVADLKLRHRSRPPNMVMARVLYVAGLIEEWGRGTVDIVQRCVEDGHPEPEFVAEAGDVVVHFVPRVPFGRSAPTSPQPLTPALRTLLGTLAAVGRPLALREVEESLREADPDGGSTNRAIRARLARLRASGLVTLVGTGRGGRWELTHAGALAAAAFRGLRGSAAGRARARNAAESDT